MNISDLRNLLGYSKGCRLILLDGREVTEGFAIYQSLSFRFLKDPYLAIANLK